MATMYPRVHSRIIVTPHTAGGQPRVIGTSITVERLCQMRHQGLTPDQIVALLPELDCEDVSSAWGYAHHHKMRIAYSARKKAS